MHNLVMRFKGRTTSEGRELIVKEKPSVITVGFKNSGVSGDDGEPITNVARIERTGEAYRVGWFYDDGEEPADSSEFTREEDLVAAVDKEIQQRSKEFGSAGR
jgi:hypothetical protein